MKKAFQSAFKLLGLLVIPGIAVAQIGLPALPSVDIGQTVGGIADVARLETLTRSELARTLLEARVDRLTRFAARSRAAIELDPDGNPAVRGTLVATGISDAAIERARAAGFRLIERGTIEGLDIGYARFATPDGLRLGNARKQLSGIAGDAEIGADHIYFASGRNVALAGAAAAMPSGSVARPAVGLIDGGVAAHPSLTGRIEQRGFAEGAPRPSSHGTAVASLLAGSGTVRAGAPGAAMLAADVYGSAQTGGSATAIARALGWMAMRRVPVVTISLVGPDNPLLRAAVRAAQGKGVLIVAAVGNDGPAAPPAYPASWPGVISVTGTDGRQRALPEAGRALHIDFAAPGADMKGAATNGRLTPLRGTSFAAPLVAGRLALRYPAPDIAAIQPAVAGLIAEAKDLGKPGRDPVFGHGLICGNCATR